MRNKPIREIKTNPLMKSVNIGQTSGKISDSGAAMSGIIPTGSYQVEEDDKILDFLVELADKNDEDERYIEADFVDFLIQKFAKVNQNNFEKIKELLDKKHKEFGDDILDEFAKTLCESYQSKYEETGNVHTASRVALERLEDRKFKKTADTLEQDPIYVSEAILKIIRIMISTMKPEKRVKSYTNILNKIDEKFNIEEISNKKAPGGAAIGVSLALIKNILNSRDSLFIRVVLDDLKQKLGQYYD